MNCHLLMTGNELMTGVTIDSNSAFIAEQLSSLGIAVTKKVTVGDSLEQLEHEITTGCQSAQLLIINGGLGPTIDDLTAEALANVAQCPLQNHPKAEQHIRQWCGKRGLQANEANLKQALLPQTASLIPNPVGSAVGIKMVINECLILCTPGVPSEMRLMTVEQIIPLIEEAFPNCEHQFIKRLQVFGIGESSIQQKVKTNLPHWPENIELGFRAGLPTLEVKLAVSSEKDIAERNRWEQKLRGLLGQHIFGEENDTLASVAIELLRNQKKTITTAESCTGGLIASMITRIAGASEVFNAGFVTYSNAMKEKMLNVNPETIKSEGAVSQRVVEEMLLGAFHQSNADFGIAVSGVGVGDKACIKDF